MKIPDLNNLIKAIECHQEFPNPCQACPYGYNYLDDNGDSIFYSCDEKRLFEDALHYLKLYQYLAEGKNY